MGMNDCMASIINQDPKQAIKRRMEMVICIITRLKIFDVKYYNKWLTNLVFFASLSNIYIIVQR